MLLYPTKRMPTVIGLTGKKFHGKDTAAKFIKEIDNEIVCLSFAGPLKKALCIIHEIPEICFNDPKLKEKTLPEWEKSPRQLAQWLGSDIYRKQFDTNIWLKNMEMRINKKHVGKDIIVTDVRFDNEAKLIHKLGGQVWKIDASKRINNNDNHETEQGISSELLDLVIYNNGTEEELKKIIQNEYNIKTNYNVY